VAFSRVHIKQEHKTDKALVVCDYNKRLNQQGAYKTGFGRGTILDTRKPSLGDDLRPVNHRQHNIHKKEL
jgi:hypothetical protein